jgi:hypothetical protein
MITGRGRPQAAGGGQVHRVHGGQPGGRPSRQGGEGEAGGGPHHHQGRGEEGRAAEKEERDTLTGSVLPVSSYRMLSCSHAWTNVPLRSDTTIKLMRSKKFCEICLNSKGDL